MRGSILARCKKNKVFSAYFPLHHSRAFWNSFSQEEALSAIMIQFIAYDQKLLQTEYMKTDSMMRKWYFYVFLTIFSFSCNGKLLSQQDSMPSLRPFSYCDLLHVPSRPYSAIEPKSYLGIYLASKKLDQSIHACKENTFIEVARVIDGTPAAKAGLKDGDIILSINGNPACDDAEHILTSFGKMIAQQKVGSLVALGILRNVQQLSLTAELEKMPIHEQPEAKHRDIDKCSGRSSTLEKALSVQNDLSAFNNILDGLYIRSNAVHNQGLAYEKKSHPLQMKELTYMMRHPMAAGEVASDLSLRVITPLHESNWLIGQSIREIASLLDVDLSLSEGPAEVSFPVLLRIMEETKNKVEEALSDLTQEEKNLLWKKALNPWADTQWNRILEISMKVDRAKLFNAFSPLLSFLTRDNLSRLKDDLINRFGNNKGPILYESMTPVGKVIVGGPGPNVYRDDAALILDLGGDNLYLNNAGGTRPGMPVSLVIDWGGNNRYISKENFSQGAGVLGGGFLIDLGGNATFVSLDASQGVGFWGIGLLYHGDGNAVYTARSFCQGVGQMGIGLIVNRRGDDRYLCSYGGQGLGLFGGAGILIDEAGNDFYQLGGKMPDFRDPSKSTVSLGQGFGQGVRPEKDINGVPGGIGMLVDEEGDDIYVADYFAQGASYYYGLGILYDMAGNDQYISGRYAQGAGIHSSVGVLLDLKGNDFYYASFGVAQGMGHDFGVGFFQDTGGNNSYWGGTLVQGAATNGSLGIFINQNVNDRDTYGSKGQAFSKDEDGMGIWIGKRRETDSEEIRIGIKKD